MHDHLPLASVRVVDMADAVGEAAARLLADLGAETVKIESVGDTGTRLDLPLHEGVSLAFAVRNANKAGCRVDLGSEAGRAEAARLVTEADIAFVTAEIADLLLLDALVRVHSHLVVVVCTPFGRTGPRRDWLASERTHLALSGSLSRSGRPGGIPLLPPDGLADATAATQAAWTGLVAHLVTRRGGPGQVVDLSQHEAVVTGLDPAFGVQGSAAAGRSGKVRRDRPPADSYPIYPCADGYVRLCLLAKRQWRGMFAWLGEPEEFADPRFDSITERVQAADRLDPLIAALFADQKGADLAEQAAHRGVPLAQVLSLGDALRADHFVASGTVQEVELGPGLVTAVPVGCLDIDGDRMGIRSPAPWNPTTTYRWRSAPVRGGRSSGQQLPFAGVRVLDLGVIVFGAEVGRAFADLGADVIKVESLSFPDGLRQTRGGEAMNASFAWGQRNKRSLGLDLRSDEGREIFLELVRASDVVLSNFKPGTLDSLGIGYHTLASANPRIVVLESAAFNARGPWARRLGYGPLVRAACGLSSLWKYDAADADCWDGVTVFPDHVAAKMAALGVASVLLRRDTTDRGGKVELGQSDGVLHHLAALAAAESLRPGTVVAQGNSARGAFCGVFACAGDDEWCVVEARTESEAAALRAVVGQRGDLTDRVASWTSVRTPAEAMETLQAAGVPAAAMVRLPELLDDPQLAARSTYDWFEHPELDGRLPAESTAASYGHLPTLPTRPAPLVGEHTADVCREVLGLDAHQVDDLVARNVLHDLRPR